MVDAVKLWESIFRVREVLIGAGKLFGVVRIVFVAPEMRVLRSVEARLQV